MVQWVKNPTLAARVAAEMRVQSLAPGTVAWIQVLVQEIPYAAGVAIKFFQKKK